jgi:hypothetical protein
MRLFPGFRDLVFPPTTKGDLDTARQHGGGVPRPNPGRGALALLREIRSFKGD